MSIPFYADLVMIGQVDFKKYLTAFEKSPKLPLILRRIHAY